MKVKGQTRMHRTNDQKKNQLHTQISHKYLIPKRFFLCIGILMCHLAWKQTNFA
jgi:hypothetical protein